VGAEASLANAIEMIARLLVSLAGAGLVAKSTRRLIVGVELGVS
jgi:hypothetical protein